MNTFLSALGTIAAFAAVFLGVWLLTYYGIKYSHEWFERVRKDRRPEVAPPPAKPRDPSIPPGYERVDFKPVFKLNLSSRQVELDVPHPFGNATLLLTPEAARIFAGNLLLSANTIERHGAKEESK